MPALLVSFILPNNRYGSHVVDLPEAPSTLQSVLDLQACIALEYGVEYAPLVAWDLLPDVDTHPGGSAPYSYFLMCTFELAHGREFGSMSLASSTPICTLADVRSVEEWIRSQKQSHHLVHLLGCKALSEPTPQLLHDYKSTQPPEQ